MSKPLGGIIGCKDKKLFVEFKRVPRCFSHFSVLVANPKKILYYTVANLARSPLNKEKKKKRKSLAALPNCSYSTKVLLKFSYFMYSVPVAPVAQRYHVTSDTLGREFDPGKRDFSH